MPHADIKIHWQPTGTMTYVRQGREINHNVATNSHNINFILFGERFVG